MMVCECCGRQIVPGHGTPDNYITYGPVTRLVGNQYICAVCAADLDEDGLFPEEGRSYCVGTATIMPCSSTRPKN